MAMRKREDEVFPSAAGIDIGASSHWVAVPRQLAEGAGCEPVREVGAMTEDLNALAAWLVSLGVDGVARDLAAAGLGALRIPAIAPVAGTFPCPVEIRLKSRPETLPVSVAFMALFKTM